MRRGKGFVSQLFDTLYEDRDLFKRVKNKTVNLRGTVLSCTLEKRKYAEASEGNKESTYENSSLPLL